MTTAAPVVFLACPHYGSFTPITVAALLTASPRSHPLIHFESASLLAYNFNRLWAECLNLRAAGGRDGRPVPDRFAMIHADVGPDPGWLDVLEEELDRTGADVISLVLAIKDMRGLTTTATQDPHTGAIQRFTLKEVHSFPETFSAADTPHPDWPLLVNTGCWLCRLDRPWVESFPGFTILDGLHKVGGQTIPAVLSEDWHASRWWADHGVKVVATRRIGAGHIGTASFRNDTVWGEWQTDFGDGAIVRPGEIEGWMSAAELDWIKDRAAAAHAGAVEVGCWHGRTTKVLAQACPGPVYAVDHFQGSPFDRLQALAGAATNGEGARARAAFERNLATELAAGKVILWRMESGEAARWAQGTPLRPDLVLLDGAHHYEQVCRDIQSWRPLTAPGGLLCGHDRNLPDVRRALDELLPGWKPATGSLWEYPVGG